MGHTAGEASVVARLTTCLRMSTAHSMSPDQYHTNTWTIVGKRKTRCGLGRYGPQCAASVRGLCKARAKGYM